MGILKLKYMIYPFIWLLKLIAFVLYICLYALKIIITLNDPNVTWKEFKTNDWDWDNPKNKNRNAIGRICFDTYPPRAYMLNIFSVKCYEFD